MLLDDANLGTSTHVDGVWVHLDGVTVGVLARDRGTKSVSRSMSSPPGKDGLDIPSEQFETYNPNKYVQYSSYTFSF